MEELKSMKIGPPILKPTFHSIGYGNPRYNSLLMVDSANNEAPLVLVPKGIILALVQMVPHYKVMSSFQPAFSQIFNLIENEKYILVVMFEGALVLLDKQQLQKKHVFCIVASFYAYGKEIRHSCMTTNHIIVSCELVDSSIISHEEALVTVYQIEQAISTFHLKCKENTTKIISANQIPTVLQLRGCFYYPQVIKEDLVLVEYHDPNPKGQCRTESVMQKKLPATHNVIVISNYLQQSAKFGPNQYNQPIVQSSTLQTQCYPITSSEAIISSTKIGSTIFYLHTNKIITAYLSGIVSQYKLQSQASPYCMEAYKQGVIFAKKKGVLGYLHQQGDQFMQDTIDCKHFEGVGQNLSIRHHLQNGALCLCLLNESGFHYYSDKHRISYNLFNITNCGLAFCGGGNISHSPTSHVAVGDFLGLVQIFKVPRGLHEGPMQKPVATFEIGLPIRALQYSQSTSQLIAGCMGGTLMTCKLSNLEHINTLYLQPAFLLAHEHTITILRTNGPYLFVGTADGLVFIFDLRNREKVYQFQAHCAIHYEQEIHRELFGSMKNMAEIWSMAVSKLAEGVYQVITSSEDQSEKVFEVQMDDKNHKLEHHLKGHKLAVTSIDQWTLREPLNCVYASCSDDKRVRIRTPPNYEVAHQFHTQTIKEWHTLTYLRLEEGGYRCAVSSQNGYLFIYDLHEKKLIYAEKIHLGGIEGMLWRDGIIVTCSSDLCLNIIYVDGQNASKGKL